MRSPAEPGRGGVRRILEGAAHGLALGILAWLLLGSLRGPGAGPDEFAGVVAQAGGDPPANEPTTVAAGERGQ